jgi:transposase
MTRKRKTKILKTEAIRPVLNVHAAGVDVGAREIYAAVAPELDAEPVRCYATFTDELKKLVGWFKQRGITTVAMEATGIYWIALAELLEEAGIEVCLVNPRHVKNVPGRKTDVQDSQWLQYLHSVGLLRAAFRSPAHVRAIRSLWRHRDSLVRQSAWHVQHMHKAFDQMNLQIHHVIADITGASGRAIVEAILAGQRDPVALAALGDKRLKANKATLTAALTGDYREEHLFCFKQACEGHAFTLKQIAEVDAQLEAMHKALEQGETPCEKPQKPKPRPRCGCPVGYDAGKLLGAHLGVDLTTIPAINASTAQTLYAEVGGGMSAFKSAKHFASWLGLNPNNKITGGKILSAHTKPCGNRVAKALRMAAQGLHHANNEMGDYYRRMRSKLGGAAAVVAVAHKLARIIHAVLRTRKPYEAALQRKAHEQRKTRSLEQFKRKAKILGFELTAIQQPA